MALLTVRLINHVRLVQAIQEYRDRAGDEHRSKKQCQDRPNVTVALACLSKTTPNLKLEYPADAHEHFLEIRLALAPWAQHSAHRIHYISGFGGPWIENRWISEFEALYSRDDNSCLTDHYGPYIPLFVPWVDLWVNEGFKYPDGLVKALLGVLRPNVPYIAVSQNDEGLTGVNELLMELIPNVLVLSAGGYGHVPIPLFKQSEPPNNQIAVSSRKYDVSYVGDLSHSPDFLRKKMDAYLQKSKLGYKYYYGPEWRKVMAESRFSMVPRGFGRTAYHLVETLQSGLIPIYVYSDVAWLPYRELFDQVGFSVHYQDGLEDIETIVRDMSTEEIVRRERHILSMIDSHFSFDGVLKQIQLFLLNQPNDLRCQKLPETTRDCASLVCQ